MKQLTRTGVLAAAVAALTLASITAAGAGNGTGQLIVDPSPNVVAGQDVSISNAPDYPCFAGVDAYVMSWGDDPETPVYEVQVPVTIDGDGNWSGTWTVPADAVIGQTFEIDVLCLQGSVPWYELVVLTVVGGEPLEPIEPPDEGTAPAEEVRATPRFTG